jgi:hypothetical protein
MAFRTPDLKGLVLKLLGEVADCERLRAARAKAV